MKKALIIILAFLGVILIAAFAAPFIFKDDIQAALDKALDENLNAEVYYNPDDLSLSLFRSFPDFSLAIGNFGIVGVEEFDGDTLLSVGNFEVTVDIMTVISGDQISIVYVGLDNPMINVLVLENGQANYDIAKSTGSQEETSESGGSSDMAIQIKQWAITNGRMVYDDATLPMVVQLSGLNHEGSGDFALDVFDMMTSTRVESFSLNYDGVEYMTNKTLEADINMGMDLAQMKFTFLDNEARLNGFAFGFEGEINMPTDDIVMDLSFGGHEIDLKSVLSLTPGDYQSYLEGVAASGQVSFDGSVTGTYNDTSMPAVVANFGISEGTIQYAEYPIPMQEIEMDATFDYPSADLTETSFEMRNFHMSLDDQEVSAYLLFKNFENYFWDFRLGGSIDLAKVTQVVPIEGMNLAGIIEANLKTKGQMADLDAGRYQQLPTSGEVEVTNFKLDGEVLPQGFGISTAQMTFDPEAIALQRFVGNAGRTDLNLSGKITNYLAYAMEDEASLVGELNFKSNLVDANEWMTETTEEETPMDTAALEVVRIPENIDFTFNAAISKIVYDDLELNDFSGQVTVQEGALRLENTGFNLLDGKFTLAGAYESAEQYEQPLYNFDFGIEKLSIPQAFESFVTIQKLAPVAEKMVGKFSTDFGIKGVLGNDMMPVYEEMQGNGLIEIASASLKDVKVLQAVSKVSKLSNESGEVSIKDLIMTAEIRDGRLYVEPFEVEIGGRKATVAGSTGVDGSLDYAVSMEVPSGQVGTALNSAISSMAGIDNVVGKDITLNLGITGTYDDPSVKLLSAKPGAGGGSEGVKAALKAQAADKVDEVKEDVKKEVEAVTDSVKAEVKQKADSVKEEAKEEVKEAVDEAKDKAKDAIKDIFGKKKKKEGGN